MFAQRAMWTVVGTLVVGAMMAHAGCTSVYDEFYRPAEGGGGTSSPLDGGGGTTTSTMAPCTSECCAPEDCPATDTPCVAATCTEGACGTENIADGEMSPIQVEGNCKTELCDGLGGVKQTLEPEGTMCNEAGGKVCNSIGGCVECNSDADCGGTEPDCIAQQCVPATCTDGSKNANETDVDCGGECLPCDDGLKCNGDGDCKSQVCGGDNMCQIPACDDGKKNGLEGDVDCGAACPQKCGPTQTCNQPADCVGGECAGTCTPNCFDNVQNNQEVGVDCGGSNSTCPGCAIGGPCAGVDANCVGTAYCESNVCTAKKAPGADCTGTNQCAVGVCDSIDKVCCNVMCSGTCKSCKLPESEGTCVDVPAATDPEDECSGADACNGAGACKKPIGAMCAGAAECASGSCPDGVCCNASCDGTCFACNLGAPGTCVLVPKGMQDPDTCTGANVCEGPGGACIDPSPKEKLGEMCSGNIDCFGNLCRGAQCKLAVGDPCTEATKDNCVSYRCSNNVCTACAGDADCPGTSCGGINYCTYPVGHACTSNTQCFSSTCIGSICQ